MLKTKSVYDPIKKDDGIRILATRFRGHGMKSGRYHVWMASLGPSEKLLRSFLEGETEWNEFRKLYKAELLSPDSNDTNNKTILNHGQKFTLRLIAQLARKQTVTLMCHCASDEKHCHLRVLEKLVKDV